MSDTLSRQSYLEKEFHAVQMLLLAAEQCAQDMGASELAQIIQTAKCATDAEIENLNTSGDTGLLQ